MMVTFGIPGDNGKLSRDMRRIARVLTGMPDMPARYVTVMYDTSARYLTVMFDTSVRSLAVMCEASRNDPLRKAKNIQSNQR